MAQQIINVGTAPNDGTGDPLRNSQQKANANFTELYSLVATGGVTTYKQDFIADATKQFTVTSGVIIKAAFLNRVPCKASEFSQVGSVVTVNTCIVGDDVTLIN